MQRADSMRSATSNPLGDGGLQEDVVLEGSMLKLGNGKRKRWHSRYFVFHSSHVLAYYSKKQDAKKEDPKPKGAFLIGREVGCEVSDLFVEQRQKGTSKEVIYCFRMTWMQGDSQKQQANSGHGSDEEDSEGEDSTHHPTSPVRWNRSTAVSPLTPSMPTTPKPELNRSTTAPKVESAKASAKASKPDSRTLSSTNRHRRILTVGPGTLPPAPISPGKSPSRHIANVKSADSGDVDGSESIWSSPSVHLNDDSIRPVYSEQERLQAAYLSSKKQKKTSKTKKAIEAAKITAGVGAAVGVGMVTFGAGVLAGMVFLGASVAAGGTSAAAEATWKRKQLRRGELVLASADYEMAQTWRTAFKVCLESEFVHESTWGQMFMLEGRKSTSALVPQKDGENLSRGLDTSNAPPTAQRYIKSESVKFDSADRWIPMDGGWSSFLGTSTQGLRIFREAIPTGGLVQSGKYLLRNFLGYLDRPDCTPMKAQVVLDTSPLDAFLCLMSSARMPAVQKDGLLRPNSEQRASFRVLEILDEHTDIIHLVFQPLYLFPTWTMPRDFVLFRYWRLEPDGSYVVCYESVEHKDCPPRKDYVRGEMHEVYTISPSRKKSTRSSSKECLITALVQVDPKGWVPITPLPILSNQCYGDAFAVAALVQLLDIRDAIVQDRFVPVSMGAQTTKPASMDRARAAAQFRWPEAAILQPGESADDDDSIKEDQVNYDYSYAALETVGPIDSATGVAASPPPLNVERWAEPDANSFRVRGPTYLKDRKKINAGSSIGRLIATDVVVVDKALFSGMSTHPTERIQLALARERQGLESDLPPFIFVVNIVLPGPPVYHGVFYYAVDDMSTIDGSDGTPSSKLCQKFFFGDDDKFRDRTFKLIPQIVQGNFMVRKAVGNTPAIMGTKLRQMYVRNPRFFEVVLDCGSSSVATGVIRLSLGYAKTLVVDMGFLLEAVDEQTLPERIFGSVRIKNLNFGPHLRKVEPP